MAATTNSNIFMDFIIFYETTCVGGSTQVQIFGFLKWQRRRIPIFGMNCMSIWDELYINLGWIVDQFGMICISIWDDLYINLGWFVYQFGMICISMWDALYINLGWFVYRFGMICTSIWDDLYICISIRDDLVMKLLQSPRVIITLPRGRLL